MVIKLSPELEAALHESARKQGLPPNVLVDQVLRDRFLRPKTAFPPRDDWERTVLGLATDCGVSLPHSAFSSEGLYE